MLMDKLEKLDKKEEEEINDDILNPPNQKLENNKNKEFILKFDKKKNRIQLENHKTQNSQNLNSSQNNDFQSKLKSRRKIIK